MNDQTIDDTIRAAARASTDLDSRLQEIFMERFGLNFAENTPKEKQPNTGYMAYGLMAVDVAVRLANMFIAIRKDKGVHRVAADLTYILNTNEFWQKNASVLIPIMHVCLNTYIDGTALSLERARREEYSSSDALIAASRAAPLELFPVIAYLLGGPALMHAVSLPLKHDLAPYFLG